MQKIMFDDHYALTQAVIEEIKNNTRRIEGGTELQEMAQSADQIFYNEDTGVIDFMYEGIDIFNHKPRYKVGEVVAVAQRYSTIAAGHPDVDTFLLQMARAHKISIESVQDLAGWNNQMFTKAELMPHQIRITGIKCERLQDISDEDCIKEGVRGEGIGFFVPGIKCKDWSKESHVDTEDGMTWKLFPTRRQAFASLIDKVSGRGTWDSNMLVVAYEFELII